MWCTSLTSCRSIDFNICSTLMIPTPQSLIPRTSFANHKRKRGPKTWRTACRRPSHVRAATNNKLMSRILRIGHQSDLARKPYILNHNTIPEPSSYVPTTGNQKIAPPTERIPNGMIEQPRYLHLNTFTSPEHLLQHKQ